jgi:hypothetical protein
MAKGKMTKGKMGKGEMAKIGGEMAKGELGKGEMGINRLKAVPRQSFVRLLAVYPATTDLLNTYIVQ